MKKAKPQPPKKTGPEYPRVMEMFKDPMPEYRGILNEYPYVFNGEVGIVKYRVTIERVEESKEVLAERLLNLWRHCDNWHHWDPLRATAKKIGIELPDAERGSLVRRARAES